MAHQVIVAFGFNISSFWLLKASLVIYLVYGTISLYYMVFSSKFVCAQTRDMTHFRGLFLYSVIGFEICNEKPFLMKKNRPYESKTRILESLNHKKNNVQLSFKLTPSIPKNKMQVQNQ